MNEISSISVRENRIKFIYEKDEKVVNFGKNCIF